MRPLWRLSFTFYFIFIRCTQLQAISVGDKKLKMWYHCKEVVMISFLLSHSLSLPTFLFVFPCTSIRLLIRFQIFDTTFVIWIPIQTCLIEDTSFWLGKKSYDSKLSNVVPMHRCYSCGSTGQIVPWYLSDYGFDSRIKWTYLASKNKSINETVI